MPTGLDLANLPPTKCSEVDLRRATPPKSVPAAYLFASVVAGVDLIVTSPAESSAAGCFGLSTGSARGGGRLLPLTAVRGWYWCRPVGRPLRPSLRCSSLFVFTYTLNHPHSPTRSGWVVVVESGEGRWSTVRGGARRFSC